MKILHYIEQLDLKSGGPVRAVLDLSRLTAEAGHSVTIISPTVNDAPKEWLTPPAAGERRPHVIEVPAFSLPGSLFPFPVVEKIKTDLISRHDLLHVHGMWAPSNVQLTAAAYRIGVPYIISLRGMLDDWPMSQRHLKKRLYLAIAGRRSLHRASFVHCTAEGEHDQSRKWFPRGRGRVIPNLLDLQPFRDAPGPELARRKFASVGLDGSTPAVLFLSRVHYKKGIEHFIKAAGILRDRGVSCRWYIAGDGDERYIDSLKSLSSSLNLGDRVHFLGMVKGVEKISLYQSADLFVLPTSQENFGFVVVEAMAAGVPVVTTKGMDLWPELEACGGALIVDQDASPIAATVGELLPDAARRKAMGEKARAWVFNNLSEEAVIAQFVAMYADAISEHTGATIGQLRGGYSPVDHGESFTALGQGPPGEGSGGEPVGKSERSVAESTVSGATDRTLAHAEASPSVSRHDSSHVVHYLPQFRLEQGGVVRAVLDLCAALAAGGDRVTILTEDHADCPDSWKRESRGVPEIVRLRGTRGGNPVLSPWSMPVVRRVVTEADVVHLHGMWTPANLQIASVAIDFRVPYVISAHGMLDDWSMNQKRPKKLFHWYTYGRNLLQNAMQVHCTARAELDQARRWFPRGSGTVVPLIFDLAPYRALPGPDVARRAFPGAWSDRPTILYLSRVNYKKGPDVLIEAASRMASRGIDFTLLIAGPGDPPEYLDRMKSLAASRGIGDRTHFLGHVSGATKLSLYEASDVFALPTSQENFGFVFFEALACGTPVVTTPGVDVWRELKSSGGAEIVERDAEKFAESLSALLSADRAAPGSLRARGQSGRRWIFEHLEPSGIIGQFRKMYGIASAGA